MSVKQPRSMRLLGGALTAAWVVGCAEPPRPLPTPSCDGSTGCSDAPLVAADAACDGGVGCSDAPSMPGDAGCDGISLRVVLGPLPLRPGARVRVYATSPSADPVDAVTDAQGTVCLHAPVALGPWDVTFIYPRHSLVTLAGLTRASLAEPVRLDPFAKETVPQAVAAGSVVGRSTETAAVQVDAVEFSTVVTRNGTYESTYSAFSTAPLVMTALELDAEGNAVNGTLVSMPRPEDGAQVNLTLPTPAREPRTVTATITLPSAGVFTTYTVADAPPTVDQVHPSAYDTVSVQVGTGRLVNLTPRGASLRARVFDGDMVPTVATFVLDHVPLGLRFNGYVHELAADSEIVVPPVNTLSLRGTALSTLVASVDAPEWTGVLVVSHGLVTTPSWRVIAADPSVHELRLPALPPGLDLAEHQLGEPPTIAQALLVRMHEGAAWNTQNSNRRSSDYDYTLGGRFRNVALDL